MAKEIQISRRAYAESIGVSDKAIRDAIKAGKIKKGVDKTTGKIIPSIANKEYGHMKEVIKPGPGVSAAMVAEKLEATAIKKPVRNIPNNIPEPDEDDIENDDKNYTYEELVQKIHIYPGLSYKEMLRRQGILDTALVKMKVEEMNRDLVRKADVEKNLFAFGDLLKKNLFNIPARIMDDILAAPGKVEAINILTVEMQQVLNLLSDPKQILQ